LTEIVSEEKEKSSLLIRLHCTLCLNMKAENAKKRSVVEKTMVTRQTTATRKLNVMTVPDKNNAKVRPSKSKPTPPASAPKGKEGGGSRKKAWTVNPSELGISVEVSKGRTKKKEKVVVKPSRVVKKFTPVVGVARKKKKVVKTRTTPKISVAPKRTKAKVTIKTKKVTRVAKPKENNKAADKPAKVVKLTAVALKKHEMRNDDLVAIRPPNRLVVVLRQRCSCE
jgi:hypothetical protein